MELRRSAEPFQIGPQRACATYLLAIAPRLMSNWVLRVANLPVFRADPNMELAPLRGRMGALLPAVVASLVVNDPALDDEPGRLVETIAADHGRLRGQLGTPIGVVLIEFQELRRLVWAATESWAIEHGDPEAVRVLTDRLMTTLDRAQVASVEAWVGSPGVAIHARAS